jgi:putative oxidoreductase
MLYRLAATTPTWTTVPLRLALGIIFLTHGLHKVFGIGGGRGLWAFAAGNAPLGLKPGWLWLGAAAIFELIGGALILVGLLTRVGAFLILCVMVVAITGVHWGAFYNPEGIEYPLALLAMAVSLLIVGGGNVSLDRSLLGGGRGRSRRRYMAR